MARCPEGAAFDGENFNRPVLAIARVTRPVGCGPIGSLSLPEPSRHWVTVSGWTILRSPGAPTGPDEPTDLISRFE